MKILLIYPPTLNEILGNNPEIIDSERGFNPPLGLLYIASYLEKNSHHEVRIIDAPVEGLNYPEIEKKIAEFSPDIVGITALTFTLVDVLKTAKIAKKAVPETKVVMGGPHAYIYPEETIKFEDVDFLILGEGELIFKQLADTIEKKGDLSKIPSLVYKENETIKKTPMAGMIENLDGLPHPARHLVPYKKYNSILFPRTPVTTMFTSRGCPYRCSFCLRPHLGKLFRARSPENVLDEIKKCVDMGIRDFLIYDDTFTVNRKRVLKICDLIISEGLNINWDCRARVDTVDEKLLEKMKKAGCIGIHYGIEAGTEKVLKNLRKQIDIKKAKEVCRVTKSLGIKTLVYFMLGSPGETRQDIEETFRLMLELKADFVHLTIFTPFPATELYLKGLETGIIKNDYWREFARNPSKDFVPPHWSEFFTLEELKKLLVEGYKKFYLRGEYILQEMLSIKSPGELFRKAKAGMKVLFMRK